MRQRLRHVSANTPFPFIFFDISHVHFFSTLGNQISLDKNYLVTTVLFVSMKFCDFGIAMICGYQFVRFHEVELNFAIPQTKSKSSTLKSTGLINVAVSKLRLLQCKNIVVFM